MLFLIYPLSQLGCIAYASLFEWLLHCFVMHKPFLGFTYARDAHAFVHHVVFKSDQTYHLRKSEDRMTIPMKWWNGPVLIVIASSPFLVFPVFFGIWWPLIMVTCTLACYYGTYEYFHWCMHLPKKRVFTMWKWNPIRSIFIKLNGHHLLHHRYTGKNFNVVLPLWDLLLGTLLLRSPVRFMQPTGELVPNVQPKGCSHHADVRP
jgi:hypothetical protein